MDDEVGFSPQEAQDSLMRFASQRGEAALRLALHAAMPRVLHVDLLHLLRLNFIDTSGARISIEADVLFAPFCTALGNGYFEFDRQARTLLLNRLDTEHRGETPRRSIQLADFLLAYFDRERRRPRADTDALFRGYMEVERWNALAFGDPLAAAEQLAQARRDAVAPGQARARVRIGALASTLATPLAAHYRLLAYAAGVQALEAGDVDRARELLAGAGDSPVVEGAVTLRPASQLLRERAAPVTEPEPDIAASDAQPVELLVLHARRDRHWANMLGDRLRENEDSFSARVLLVDDGDERPENLADAERRLIGARAAVVLLSPDYLASNFFRLLERDLFVRVADGSLRLLWLKAEHCAWQSTRFSNYQAALSPTRALSDLSRDEVDTALRRIAAAVASTSQGTAARELGTVNKRTLVFISHWHVDTAHESRLLSEDLQRAGFGDSRHSAALDGPPTGVEWEATTTEQMDRASIVLVLVGPAGIENSGLLRAEVDLARRQGALLLPVLVRGARMPAPGNLPEDLAFLAVLESVRLRDRSWNADVKLLVDRISRLTGERPAPVPKRVLRVWLSSTTIDLRDEREAVRSAIQAAGHVFAGLEEESAMPTPALQGAIQALRRCDLMLLIAGMRYGFAPEERLNPRGLSLVELEYEEAIRAGIPVLAWLKDTASAFSLSNVDSITGDGDGGANIERFRHRLATERLPEIFSSSDELAVSVQAALHAFTARLAAGVEQAPPVSRGASVAVPPTDAAPRTAAAFGEVDRSWDFALGQPKDALRGEPVKLPPSGRKIREAP